MAVIEFNNVCVNRQEQPVLKNVSVTVNEGDLVFLLGRVGSGKSTFLKSLYYEAIVASGEARILDFDLRRIVDKICGTSMSEEILLSLAMQEEQD